ncbi:MAG: hypothetical protein V9E90_08850 [Saprospiraceae bacterium]
MAPVGRPPVLRVGHQRGEVFLQRGQVELLEFLGVVEIRAQRIRLLAVLVQDIQVQLLRPPVGIRLCGGRGARAVLCGEWALAFVAHGLLSFWGVIGDGDYSSNRLRNIQAVFSWTSMRCVSRSARRLVVGLVHQREQLARGACRGFLGGDEVAHHVQRLGLAIDFLDRRQLDELLVGAGGGMAQGADALGDQVERVPLLGVLAHEHQVQGVEHRPGDVPVEVVRHQVERVAVGQQAGQALGDGGAVLVGDADVELGDFDGFVRFHDDSSFVD